MEFLEVDGTQVDDEMADDAGIGLLHDLDLFGDEDTQVPKQPLTSSSTSSSFGMLSASSNSNQTCTTLALLQGSSAVSNPGIPTLSRVGVALAPL